MDWGVAVNVHENYHQTIEIANALDSSGVDYIWIVDFPAPRFAPSMAVKIASMTSSSRIGIGLLPASIYDTDYIVRFTETLVTEFGERFDLLIGPGDRSALKAVGLGEWVPKRIVEKTVNSGLKIKEILQARGIECPVWLAAQGPKMIAESKKLDGVLLNLTDSDMIKWAISLTGKGDSSFKIGIFTPTKLADTSEKAPSSDFLFSAAIVALGASRAILREFNLEDEISDARREFRKHGVMNSQVLNRISMETLLRWGIFETVEKLVERMSVLDHLNVDLSVFGPPVSHSMKSIKLLMNALSDYRSMDS